MVTVCPVAKPCGVMVVIVTVLPDSVAPVGEAAMVAVLAVNALLTVGGATTVRLAFEVLPVPPSVEVTWTELFGTPAVVPVTSTENVHWELLAIVPPERLIEPLPATAVIVPAPHEPVMVGVAATTTPAGKVSVKATPLNATFVFGFVMLKLSVLLAL